MMVVSESLLLISIISISLGQFGIIPFLPENFNLYVQDVLLLSFVLFTFFYLFISRKIRTATLDNVVILGTIFIFWAFITFIYNYQWQNTTQNILGFSYLFRFALYFLVYFLVLQLKDTNGTSFEKRLYTVLVATAFITSVSGFVQLLIMPDLSELARTSGYDPHKNRLVSAFLDPNFTGAFLVLGINFVISKLNLRKILNLFILGVLLTALFFTFSRSAWIMLSVSILILGFIKSKKLLIGALIIAFLAYFLVPRVQTRIAGITDPDDSAKLRIVSWERALTVAKTNLFFGVGFNNFRTVQEDYGFFDYNIPEGGHSGAGSDSSLLLVLATTGIPGLLLYLLFYANLIWSSFKGALKNNKIALGLFISLIGLLLESNFVNSLFFTPILLWIFAALPLIYSYRFND